MKTADEIKADVQRTYAAIATAESATSCCDTPHSLTSNMADSYQGIEGYVPDANLGLGCGVPTAFTHMREGMTVLDLGSGAGNDVFIASHHVGQSGTVIGVDMTQAMIDRARKNAESIGIHNVDFRLGEIEALPVDDNSVDLVISNCVLNLVPDKRRAFDEIFRVLKPGGSFVVSDVVLEGELPGAIRKMAALWAACISGAMQMKDYTDVVVQRGFTQMKVLREKTVPFEPSADSISPEIAALINSVKTKSITLTATKGVQPEMFLRRAVPTDLDAITSLLNECDLLELEFEKHLANFIVLIRQGKLIGCGGMEIYGDAALMRSVAIHPLFQRLGLGELVYGALEIDARMRFLTEAFLFTFEAKTFFERRGYSLSDRGSMPASMHESAEYRDCCCDSAHVMRKQLSQTVALDEASLKLPVILSSSCCG